MALAGQRALGRPNHSIEHCRHSFVDLLYGYGEVEERARRWRTDPVHQLHRFGRGSSSEILARLFPDTFPYLNHRNRTAAEILALPDWRARGQDDMDRLLETCPACGQLTVQRIFSHPTGARRARAPP